VNPPIRGRHTGLPLRWPAWLHLLSKTIIGLGIHEAKKEYDPIKIDGTGEDFRLCRQLDLDRILPILHALDLNLSPAQRMVKLWIMDEIRSRRLSSA
jgi:hypothetical protein